ncbi:MAG: adenylyltransferase/cytidyltransferase family protein [Patescibacteria group bacterium]
MLRRNPRRVKKVGIFSGSFDPVHEGHLAFALQASKRCNLNKIYFMVEPSPRRKQGVRALEHREKMVALATAGHKILGQIMLGHDRFTVELTLPNLLSRFKGSELYFLMGDDVFRHLPQWGNLQTLVEQVSFIVGSRTANHLQLKQQQELIFQITGLKSRVKILTTDQHHLSSSAVRANLRRGRLEGISHPVKDYILRQGLYQSTGISK